MKASKSKEIEKVNEEINRAKSNRDKANFGSAEWYAWNGVWNKACDRFERLNRI